MSSLPPTGPSPDGRGTATRGLLQQASDRVATALGLHPADREVLLRAMVDHHAKEPGSYWLQLVLALGIATLGLVLGSGAVVIGAMLISPLMGPIVDLAMALAVGSSFLGLRAFVRTAASIVVVVAASALLTRLLPFHEVTAEIAARTAPTALDLLVASFCAVAAAFTAARPQSDTSGTAAGTAIGIALVPPLCVTGYGLGTRQYAIARGAALLFTANLCAILLVALLFFLVLGFAEVNVAAIEGSALGGERGAHPMERTAAGLRRAFGAGYGRALRLLMPLVLLIAVYFPLRRALAEVSWEVRVRAAVSRILESAPATRDAVRSAVVVERHAVVVRLVIVARTERAARLERELRTQIAAAAGVVPTVSVTAVPDMAALQAAVTALSAAPAVTPALPPTPDLAEARRRLAGVLAETWPREAAGPLLRWELTLPEHATPVIEVVHLGTTLGRASELLLGHALSAGLGTAVDVRDTAVPAAEVSADAERGASWLPSLARAVEVVNDMPGLHLCATTLDPSLVATRLDLEAVTAAAHTEIARLPADRVTLRPAARWSAQIVQGPCPTPAPTPMEWPTIDAGATDAARNDAALRSRRR